MIHLHSVIVTSPASDSEQPHGSGAASPHVGAAPSVVSQLNVGGGGGSPFCAVNVVTWQYSSRESHVRPWPPQAKSVLGSVSGSLAASEASSSGGTTTGIGSVLAHATRSHGATAATPLIPRA